MKGARRLLGVLLATAVAGLVAVPAAQATIFERFRFDDAYSFQEEICGIELQIEGTVSGQVRIRTGAGGGSVPSSTRSRCCSASH